jgi:uncharacterized membrane protein (DUF4010 family)
MANDVLMLRLGLALAIGLVVGVERGWRERSAEAGSRTAGIRTFALSGLLGGTAAALAQALASPLLLGLVFAAFCACFGAFSWREAVHDNTFSVTSLIAAMGVFALGALAVAGDPRAAAAGGVAAAGLLASREVLHDLLQRLTWPEIRSTLLLLGMTAIVLPLLPEQAIDPWGRVVPREIWLFTLLAAALSFAGYVGVRLGGAGAGVLITSLAGALASSTAVTVALARRAAADPLASRLLAGGAALAGMVSILRVLVLVGIVAPPMLAGLGPPAGSAALVFGLVGAALMRGPRAAAPEAGDAARLGNPFDLAALLLFALLFAAVALLSGWLAAWLGPAGLYASAALLGLADVDLISLGTARLAAAGSVPAATGAAAVLVALGVNAGARVAYAAAGGPPRYALWLGAATALAALAGTTALFVARG